MNKSVKHDNVVYNTLDTLLCEIKASIDNHQESSCDESVSKYLSICNTIADISTKEKWYNRLYKLYKDAKLFIPWIRMYIERMSTSDEYVLDILEYGKKVDDVILKFKHLFTRENHECLVLRGLAKMIPLLVGRSREIQRVCEQIKRFGMIDTVMQPSPVLICGDTGTGKELVSKCIHYFSHRYQPDKENFYAVNCGALTEGDLLYSELFGHVKGAFTGAESDRDGMFKTADGGTLFLDEIGDANSRVQASLLRVLETGEYKPLGSDKTEKCDVRVIAATNTSLINNKHFRPDLYYRLESLTIHVPPLKNRKEDIVDLTDYFLCKAFQERNLTEQWYLIHDDVIEALKRYDWPGNIRQLKGAIERALTICNKRDDECYYITAETLPEDLHQITKVSSSDRFNPIIKQLVEVLDNNDETKNLRLSKKVGMLVEAFEKNYLKKALEETGGNVTEAAKLVKLHRTSFYDKITKYEIDYK